MKTFLLIILSVFFETSLVAQQTTIKLPTYQVNRYEIDTVYTYYGGLLVNGNAFIHLTDSLDTKFVTGVKFKLVVDSTNQGNCPLHCTFLDSAGKHIPIYKNDTLLLSPTIVIRLFSGAIGFHIIIEGTPLIQGEKYLCEVYRTSTLGDDWSLLIRAIPGAACVVTPFSYIPKFLNTEKITISPNPFHHFTTIEWNELTSGNFDFILYNIQGHKVRTIKDITSKKLKVERDNLPSGIYILELRSKEVSVKGKLLIQ